MVITAFPGGTWEAYEPFSWNEFGSKFLNEAVKNNIILPEQNFIWSTQLDGGILASIKNMIFRGTAKHNTWNTSGLAFTWWAYKFSQNESINVITHSHGGNMTFYAAAYGLRIKTLITVATPVRFDMRNIIKKALPNIEKWYHIYSDKDKWQLFGAIRDGKFGFVRKMPIPKEKGENIFIPGYNHSELITKKVFTENKIWNLLI